MTDLNPFDEPLHQAKTEVKNLTQRKNAVEEKLHWFNSNNETDLQNKLDSCRDQADQLRSKYDEIGRAIASCQQKRDEMRAKTRTLFNPKNWFATDQRQLRRTQRDLKRAQESKMLEKNSLSDQISKAEQDISSAAKTIARYSSFDLRTQKKDLKHLKTELAASQAKAKRIAERKKAVDDALKPVVEQMQQYMELKQREESIRERAATFDRQLSNANNSYERAMVHEQCETEFNVGSPRKVIGKAEANLRRIARDYEKVYSRAVEIGKKVARRIDAIVIDGNNLCYDNNVFIGLSALEQLIPILQLDYKVTIIFDAAIRSMLKVNDQAISRKLGNQIQVHIVANRGKADETVLDLAENNKYTYILSNDRFGEYNDKRAIRDQRVLRHEIVNGYIFIHDLGVNARYNAT